MSDDWETPKWLMYFFKDFYDPCPLYADFDGLDGHWSLRNFVNAPHSKKLEFVLKAIEEAKGGKHTILLIPFASTTEWHRALLQYGAHPFYAGERLHYNEAGGARFCSVLWFIWRRLSRSFIRK